MTGEEIVPAANAVPASGNEAQITELSKGMATLAQAVQGIQQGIEKMQSQNGRRPRDEEVPNEDEDEDEDDDEVDDKTLETLPRKDFASHIVKQVSKLVDKQLKSISQKTDSVRSDVERDRVQKAVLEVAGKHKDFWDWSDEIKKIAEETPGISPLRAYRIARSEDSEKVKKLSEKYKSSEDLNSSGDKNSDKGKRRFGGFTPTSGVVTKDQKMTKKDAAEKAWEDTMGNLGSGEGA